MVQRCLRQRCWRCSPLQRLDRCPHSVYHFGVQSAHDGRGLHQLTGLGSHSGSKTEPTPQLVDGPTAEKPTPLPARPLSDPVELPADKDGIFLALYDSQGTLVVGRGPNRTDLPTMQALGNEVVDVNCRGPDRGRPGSR